MIGNTTNHSALELGSLPWPIPVGMFGVGQIVEAGGHVAPVHDSPFHHRYGSTPPRITKPSWFLSEVFLVLFH